MSVRSENKIAFISGLQRRRRKGARQRRSVSPSAYRKCNPTLLAWDGCLLRCREGGHGELKSLPLLSTSCFLTLWFCRPRTVLRESAFNRSSLLFYLVFNRHLTTFSRVATAVLQREWGEVGDWTQVPAEKEIPSHRLRRRRRKRKGKGRKGGMQVRTLTGTASEKGGSKEGDCLIRGEGDCLT